VRTPARVQYRHSTSQVLGERREKLKNKIKRLLEFGGSHIRIRTGLLQKSLKKEEPQKEVQLLTSINGQPGFRNFNPVLHIPSDLVSPAQLNQVIA